jgi:hypothetical protein
VGTFSFYIRVYTRFHMFSSLYTYFIFYIPVYMVILYIYNFFFIYNVFKNIYSKI